MSEQPTPTSPQPFHGGWRVVEDEHQALAAVLHALHFLLDEIGAGRVEPDFRLLRAMLYYLTEYPERRHHPNEDRYLFARLKEKTHEADAVIARLEKEHAAAEQRVSELDAALHAFASRAPGGFEHFREVFDRYAHFYRQHMMTEEREVLPLAERYFTADDWAYVAAGWQSAGVDPLAGTTKRDEWQAIFDKLVRHAPPPIGLGAGPYPDDVATRAR
jgi:hemerythrin-like domain-containing protein